MTAPWNPDQYLRFAAERKQPFVDLMSLVERRPEMRSVDLGCGTGAWTRELHDALGARETLGVDSSDAMLAKAQAFANDEVRFVRAAIESFAPERPFDLVFSNAALHWVPDHESLFARIAGFVAPGGQLAVQMPANEDHPSHVLAAAVAGEFGVAPRLSDILPAERYAQLLHRHGFARQHVRMQIYGHLLPSSADVVEWVKGSLLTDYERRMEPERFRTFLARYGERVIAELGDARPFFYTYKRVLLWGSRE
jgi:trans-aconitate 2-methyltransferase